MTKEEFYLKRAKLQLQIEDAEKLGCKNVVKHSVKALTKLEISYRKEHLSNPLFSYYATKEEVAVLMKNDVKPTFIVKITFNNGNTCDMIFYHTIKKGVKNTVIEAWAKNVLASSIQHPENIKSAHLVGLFNN